MKKSNYPHIFSPIKIGNVWFRNRIWSAPAGVHLLQNGEYYPSEATMAYYIKKAAGGAAVITYSAQMMDFNAPYHPTHGRENIMKPETHRMYNRFTDAIHGQGAKVSLELLAFQYHRMTEDGRRIPLSVNGGYDEMMEEETEAFTRADLECIAQKYGDVAENAVQCGFDMLLIHGGHGLALSQFYSKTINRRNDEFGAQCLENRMRFADMILDSIRARVGNKLLIEYRISGEEDPAHGDGYQVEDCIEMIQHIQDRIDIAHISTGAFYNGTENITHPTEFLPHGCNVGYAEKVKACPDIHIPVLTLGGIQTPELAEEVLASGKADLVAMARGLIADADRVNKWRASRADEAIPCIRCFHCLDYERAPFFACSVNPTVGRESIQHLLYTPSGQKRNVVIIGGGPAGMQAAITAAQTGHKVTLLEKNAQLGGKLVFSRQVPFKHDLANFMDWQIHMIQKLGVKVCLNCLATPEMVSDMNADVVLAAIGSDAVVPPIPGIHGANVITAEQAYKYFQDGNQRARKIVVLGGGLVGCETALYLATEQNCQVTVLEMQKDVAQDEMYLTRDALLERLNAAARIITQARCTEIGEETVTYLDETGTSKVVDCDMVVLAAGMRPKTDESMQFFDCASNYTAIGDCVKASNVRNATRMGYDAAMQI